MALKFMHILVALFAVKCSPPVSENEVSNPQVGLEIRTSPDRFKDSVHTAINTSEGIVLPTRTLAGSKESLPAKKPTASAQNMADIPIIAKNDSPSRPESNPVQISVIITNGNEPKHKKTDQAEANKKPDTVNNSAKPHQGLGDLLLKPNNPEPSDSLDENDILALAKYVAKIKAMTDGIDKILKKSKHYQKIGKQEMRENLVNYHVIEITENKKK